MMIYSLSGAKRVINNIVDGGDYKKEEISKNGLEFKKDPRRKFCALSTIEQMVFRQKAPTARGWGEGVSQAVKAFAKKTF